MKKARKKKRRKYTTFMIITGDEKRIRAFRYPQILAKVLLLSIFVFVAFTIAITYHAVTLSKDYQAKLENIKNLEIVNKQQQSEIENLNVITSEVREKLKSLEEIQAKVKELVGIKD